MRRLSAAENYNLRPSVKPLMADVNIILILLYVGASQHYMMPKPRIWRINIGSPRDYI